MSNKTEIIKIGLLTALVALGMIGVFAVVAAPDDGIVGLVHAYRPQCAPPDFQGGARTPIC
jgi:hypothetical protein